MCGEMRLFLDSLAPAAEAIAAMTGGGGSGAKGGVAAAATQRAASGDGGGPPSRTATPPPPLNQQQQQQQQQQPPISLRGKVGAAFTAIGGPASGHGGAETVFASFHATFLSHGMVVVGAPPSPMMDGAPGSTPLGAVASGGGEEERSIAIAAAAAAHLRPLRVPSPSPSASSVGGVGGGVSSFPSAALAAQHVTLSGTEVRLGYSLGQWAAQVGALLHGDDAGGCE